MYIHFLLLGTFNGGGLGFFGMFIINYVLKKIDLIKVTLDGRVTFKVLDSVTILLATILKNTV